MDASKAMYRSPSVTEEKPAGNKRLQWHLLLQIAAADAVLWVFPDLALKSLGTVYGLGAVETGGFALFASILFILVMMNATAAAGRAGLSRSTALIAFSAYAFLAWMVQATTVLYVSLGSALVLSVLHLTPAIQLRGRIENMALGLLLAATALGLVESSSGTVSFPAALMVLGYPVVNILGVAVKRMLSGGSPYVHDRSHMHDAMISAGKKRADIRIYSIGISVICALVAVAAVVAGLSDVMLYAVMAGILIIFVLG